jgi:hypothetical protein
MAVAAALFAFRVIAGLWWLSVLQSAKNQGRIEAARTLAAGTLTFQLVSERNPYMRTER